MGNCDSKISSTENSFQKNSKAGITMSKQISSIPVSGGTNMGKNIMEIMQAQLQEKVEKLQSQQKQRQKGLMARQTLDSQLSENNLVKDELDHLEEDAKVFKLIGPALIRQDTNDAKQNVNKRIEYISGELKRHDETLADLSKKEDDLKEELQTIQTQMQKLAQA